MGHSIRLRRTIESFHEDNVERSKAVVSRLTQGNYYASSLPGDNSLNESVPSVLVHNAATSAQPSTSSPMSDAYMGCASVDASSTSSISSFPLPLYDVFLGGSCGNTVWRRQLVIPFLKKRAITYYDPQRSVWSENMIYEESIAKENSSLFLFVLDPATVNATSFLEIAYFAARKAPKLLVVFLGKTEWREKAHPEDLPDRLRTCQLLDRILHAHQVPMLHSIQDALNYIEEVIIGGKKWSDALAHPRHRFPFLSLQTKRVVKVAGVGARAAWTRLRSTAAKVLVTTTALNAGILLSMHLVFPQISLIYVILPLVLINILFFGLTAAFFRLRHRWPRLKHGAVGDIRAPGNSLPIPRLSAVTTPLLLQGGQPTKPLSISQSRRAMRAATAEGSSYSAAVPLQFSTLDPASSHRRRAPGSNRRLEMVEQPHDVYLACSSCEELDWVNSDAIPFLAGNDITYSSLLACDSLSREGRMTVLMKGSKQFKQLLYCIPSTKTFLSGMVEIAYLLGHANWQVTVCVPREAEQLEAEEGEDESDRAARRRRNDCYAIAFCYLKDMAKRRQSRVYGHLDEALEQVKLAVSRDSS